MTLWSDTITLTLTIDGNAISGSVIASASWRAGRPDWFAQLAPGTASFTLRGDLTASISCGDSLVLSRGSDTLWTGKVASVGLSSLPLRVVGQNLDETIVTGGDFVAQLGEARLKSKNIAYDTFDDQLEDMLSTVGLTATVSRTISLENPFVRARTGYTGSVLDWLNEAEREANTVTAVRPDGEIVLCLRDAIPDYGERVYEFAVGPAMPDPFPDASSLWRMDESSGDITDVVDARDGTAAGTPTYNAIGPWGASGPTAILFEKDDAADQFAVGDSYDLTGSAWTIAGWVRWSGDSSSRSTIVSKIAAGPNGWILQVGTGGEVRYQALNGGSVICNILTAAGTIPANTWKHIAVRLLSGSVAIFVDGQVVGGPTALGGSIPNTAASLRFGSNAGASEWMDGRLCMWAVWNANALLQAQIQSLIYLGRVDLPSPQTWSVSRSITSVINHWLIAGTPYTDATSISTYGRRTWDVDDASDNNYSAALRTVMKDPRPIVHTTLSVTEDSSVLITMAPLDLVEYDGALYQVLEIDHSVSPDRWDVTLTLDRTQNDMTGEASILPV